jgi:hypothetical protein
VLSGLAENTAIRYFLVDRRIDWMRADRSWAGLGIPFMPVLGVCLGGRSWLRIGRTTVYVLVTERTGSGHASDQCHRACA